MPKIQFQFSVGGVDMPGIEISQHDLLPEWKIIITSQMWKNEALSFNIDMIVRPAVDWSD